MEEYQMNSKLEEELDFIDDSEIENLTDNEELLVDVEEEKELDKELKEILDNWNITYDEK